MEASVRIFNIISFVSNGVSRFDYFAFVVSFTWTQSIKCFLYILG